MENHMERSDQASAAKQSSEGQLPASPELFQEHSIPSVASREERLFRRITFLTLLLGIMIGICLTLAGGLWYVVSGHIPNAFYPTSPIIYRLLGPLMMTSIGVVALLWGRVRNLRRQHPALRSGRFGLFDIFPWPWTSPSFGLLFVWIGSSTILLICFGLDPHIWGTVEMVGVIVLGISFIAELIFPFIRNRRTTQQ